MAASNLSGLPFYVSEIDRKETEKILKVRKDGVFLIRDSKTIRGDYVLSVSENNKVSHYIINNKGSHFQIGENTFQDIPAIVEFYKRHLLETTTLVESAVVEPPCKIRVTALYNFAGNDVEDLPFRRGDVLTVISKPEDKWWKAEDSTGKQGLIPVPYVSVIEDNVLPPRPTAPASNQQAAPMRPPSNPTPPSNGPTLARAIMTRIVPYDDTQLDFKIGDFIRVLQRNENGTWYGRLQAEDSDGTREGYFPFSHVRCIDENSLDESNGL